MRAENCTVGTVLVEYASGFWIDDVVPHEDEERRIVAAVTNVAEVIDGTGDTFKAELFPLPAFVRKHESQLRQTWDEIHYWVPLGEASCCNVLVMYNPWFEDGAFPACTRRLFVVTHACNGSEHHHFSAVRTVSF